MIPLNLNKMNNTNKLVRMSLALGGLTLIGLFFSALALSDIYKNVEPDLNMEWNVVRTTFLFTLMFVVLSSITILKIQKK